MPDRPDNDLGRFSQQLSHVQARVEAVRIRAQALPSDLLDTALAELSINLEELAVSQEELRQQAEALVGLQAKVEAERQRYLELFEFAPDAYLVTDLQGAIREANRAAAHLLNVSASRLQRRPLAVFVAKDDLAEFRHRLNKAGEGESAQHWALRLGPRGRPSFTADVSLAVLGNPLVWAGQALLWRLQDISDRQQAEDELNRSHAALRDLARRMDDLREDERRRIAHEVHDELGSALTAIKMDVAQIGSEAARRNLPQLAERANAAGRLIDETVETMRRIARELRPAVLDDMGLVPAADLHLQQFEARSGIRCTLAVSPGVAPVTGEVAVALFRVMQELLTNVARHAQATQVDVRLAQDNNHVRLEVRDNGRGIAPEEAASTESLGLLGMRERVRALNGDLRIKGQSGRGTTAVVTVPLSPSNNLAAGPKANEPDY